MTSVHFPRSYKFSLFKLVIMSDEQKRPITSNDFFFTELMFIFAIGEARATKY